MNRRDLLMKGEVPERPEVNSEPKLSDLVDKAAAFAAMCESRGWKMLYRDFIEPRISLDRIFRAKGPFKRAEEIASVRELDLLMRTIKGIIEDGQKANEKLEQLRKKN